MTGLQKFLAALVLLIAAYAFAGFLVAPHLMKWILEKKLSEGLHRPVTIGKLYLNPFSFSVDVENFVMHKRNDDGTFLTFKELHGSLQTFSLFEWGLVLRDIHLNKPYINVNRNEDESYNFSDLLEYYQPQAESESEPFRFSVNNIHIKNGSIDFYDGLKKTKHEIRELNISIPLLSALPDDVNDFVTPVFQATINDTPVALTGRSKPFHDSLETTFDINIKDLDVTDYLSYIPYNMNFKIVSGLISAKGDISFIQYKKKPPSLMLKGDFDVSKIRLVDLNGNPVASTPSARISLHQSELLRPKPKINLARVFVQSLDVHVRRDKSGKVQLPVLMTTVEIVEAEIERGVDFVVNADEIQVAQGKVTFTDHSFPSEFVTTASPIDITVLHFSTEKDKKSALEVSLKTKHREEVKLSSDFTVIPLAASGLLEVKGITPNNYAPYYDKYLEYHIREGTVDASSKFTFSLAGDKPLIKTSDTEVTLRSFTLRPKNEEVDFVKIPEYTLKQGEIDFEEKVLTIGDVSTKNGFFAVKRYSDGTLNMEELLPRLAEALEEAAKKKAEKPWMVLIKKMNYENYTITLEDLVPDEPVKLTLGEIRLTGENISTKKGSRGDLSYSFKLNDRGTVSAKSSFSINPVSSDITLNVKDMDIIPFQPYITDRIKILITGGAASAKGKLSYGLTADGGLTISYKGEASMTGFSSVDKANANDFLKWDSFYLNGIDAGHNPFHLNIREVALTDFYSRLIINPDGSLNVQDVLADEKTGPDAVDAESAEEKNENTEQDTIVKQIQIEEVTLQGGTVNFSDRHIKPNYSANFLEVGGRISGLSSAADSMADIDLRGKLENYAPLEITGKINPLREDLYVNLEIDFHDMDLTPVSPYSARYLGYNIQKGKLSLDLEYMIVGKKLDSQNKIYLDQLTLGEKVDSPDALKVPVSLAISLLKDSRGEIHLDMPVSGEIDDPEFNAGRIAVKMFVNLIIKAATSPFALLGAMFEGGEELSYLEFDYGYERINEEGQKKLDALIQALSEKTGLELEIQAYIDIENDREGLQQVLFERKVKAQKLKDLVKKRESVGSVDDITVEQEEYEKYLTKAYKKEDFPKPRNIIGIAKKLPVPEMEKLMLTHIVISDDDLRQLAAQRARAVKNYILASEKIAQERIFLVKPESLEPEEKEGLKKSRIDFSLQ